MLAQAVEVRIVLEAVFEDVADVHHRLDGQQAQRLEQSLFVRGQRQRARGPAFVEMWQQALENADQFLRFLVAGPGLLAVAVERAFDGGQIGERQFGHDRFDVGQRVDAARDMDDVGVLEAAHDTDDGVGFADVGQELVAQAFALRGAGDQPGDIDELDDRRLHALRLDDGGELREARIGHFDDADVRLDGAEGVVLGGDSRFGQGIEEGGLADVGQADDTALEAHARVPMVKRS
jgi:hypothetical protein